MLAAESPTYQSTAAAPCPQRPIFQVSFSSRYTAIHTQENSKHFDWSLVFYVQLYLNAVHLNFTFDIYRKKRLFDILILSNL